MEHDADRRRELERVAFGAPETADEVAAARAAQIELAELGRQRRRGGGAAQDPAFTPDSPAPDSRSPDSPAHELRTPESPPDSPPRGVLATDAVRIGASRSRRFILVGVVAVSLLVGAAAGVGGSFVAAPHRVVASTTTTVTAQEAHDSASTSRLAAGDPSTVVSAGVAARSWFLSKQQPADVYPVQFGEATTFDRDSTRLVATTANGTRVWVAEIPGSAGGFCLITLAPVASDDTQTAAEKCATLAQFSAAGLSVIDDQGISAEWLGGNVVVTQPAG